MAFTVYTVTLLMVIFGAARPVSGKVKLLDFVDAIEA